jgi:hypothetical protein
MLTRFVQQLLDHVDFADQLFNAPASARACVDTSLIWDTIERLAKSSDGSDGMDNDGTAEPCVRSLFSASYTPCLTAPIVQVTTHAVDMAIKDLRATLQQAPSGCSLTIDNTDINNTNHMLAVDSDDDNDDESVRSSDTEDGEISDDNEEEEKDLEPEDIVRHY